MEKEITTLSWVDYGNLLFGFTQERFGRVLNHKPTDFVELLNAFKLIQRDALTAMFENILSNNEFQDITETIVSKEDACLFAVNHEKPAVIDILMSYLKHGETDSKSIPALWCYLDDEKLAIAHFVNRNGWCVELYCKSTEKFSALHLIKEDNQPLVFIPVIFKPNLKLYESYVDIRGNVYLRDYLPREKFNCLSCGSIRQARSLDSSDVSGRYNYQIDSGDTL